MNDEKKQRLLFLRLAYSGTAVTLVSLAAIIFLPSLQSVFITLAALSAAGAAVLFGILFDQMRKRIDCSDRLVEKANGYAEIRYDKKTETAVISGKFSEITGLDVPNGAIDDTDYKKLVLDMISYPSSAGVDIYMAARPESWIKIHNFENEDFEITMISDVSEYNQKPQVLRQRNRCALPRRVHFQGAFGLGFAVGYGGAYQSSDKRCR